MPDLTGDTTKSQTGNTALYVFIDLDSAYFPISKPSQLKQYERCMFQSVKLLEFARKNKAEIAFFTRSETENDYRISDPIRWADNLAPQEGEKVYSRTMPSCYSSEAFYSYLQTKKCPHIVMAGLTGTQACLSTAVHAFHLRHDVTYICDASATPQSEHDTSYNTHKAVTQIIDNYARVLTARQYFDQFSLKRARRFN